MSDIKKFIKENRPQVSGSGEFMSEVKRQLDLLPEPYRQEKLFRLAGKMAVISIVSAVLIALLLCLCLLFIAESSGLLPDMLTYIIIPVVFTVSILIPLYKQEIF